MSEDELFEMRKVIKLTLMKIGLRCDLIGFAYFCLAVEMAILDPTLLGNLCRDLYTQVGERFGSGTGYSVERSMRHTLDCAFCNSSFSEINNIFNTKIYAKDEKPTVGEMIRLMAEYYNMGLYKTYVQL